jgi:hypothetical protein
MTRLAGCCHHGPFGSMNVIFGLALACAAPRSGG